MPCLTAATDLDVEKRTCAGVPTGLRELRMMPSWENKGGRMESCDKCTQGPAGSDGHADLFSYSFLGECIGMKCRACGRMWMRQRLGSTRFAWTPSLASEGALLPQM